MNFNTEIKDKLESIPAIPSNKVWQKIEKELDVYTNVPKTSKAFYKSNYFLFLSVGFSLLIALFLFVKFESMNKLKPLIQVVDQVNSSFNKKDVNINFDKGLKLPSVQPDTQAIFIQKFNHNIGDNSGKGSSQENRLDNNYYKDSIDYKQEERDLPFSNIAKYDNSSTNVLKGDLPDDQLLTFNMLLLKITPPYITLVKEIDPNLRTSINQEMILHEKSNLFMRYKLFINQEACSFSYRSLHDNNQDISQYLNQNFNSTKSIGYGIQSLLRISQNGWLGIGVGYRNISFNSTMAFKQVINNANSLEAQKLKLITPVGFFLSAGEELTALNAKKSKISLSYLQVPISYEYYVLVGKTALSFSLEHSWNILMKPAFNIQTLDGSFEVNKDNLLGQKNVFNELNFAVNIEKQISSEIIVGVSPFLKTSVNSISKPINDAIETKINALGMSLYLKYK